MPCSTLKNIETSRFIHPFFLVTIPKLLLHSISGQSQIQNIHLFNPCLMLHSPKFRIFTAENTMFHGFHLWNRHVNPLYIPIFQHVFFWLLYLLVRNTSPHRKHQPCMHRSPSLSAWSSPWGWNGMGPSSLSQWLKDGGPVRYDSNHWFIPSGYDIHSLPWKDPPCY